MRRWIAAALLSLVPFGGVAQDAPPPPEEVVAGLSQNTISITANFEGTEILIFAAIKRDQPPPPGKLGVIVTLAGPDQQLTVRRKSREFGIWVNTEGVDIDRAPSFYAVATSGPWNDVITDTEDLRWKVSIPRAIRSVGATVADSPAFTEALIRIRTVNGLYQMLPDTVKVEEEALVSTAIELPANLIEGNYRARIFLTRGGKVVDVHVAEIGVHKAGLERWLYRLSQEAPFVYGILAIVIAISAGWLASAVFRYIRT